MLIAVVAVVAVASARRHQKPADMIEKFRYQDILNIMVPVSMHQGRFCGEKFVQALTTVTGEDSWKLSKVLKKRQDVSTIDGNSKTLSDF